MKQVGRFTACYSIMNQLLNRGLSNSSQNIASAYFVSHHALNIGLLSVEP